MRSRRDYRSRPALRFDRLVLLVGGGTFYGEDLFGHLVSSGAPVVGVDGGGDKLRGPGCQPSWIVGDQDSTLISSHKRMNYIEMMSQEESDFEKCLSLIQAPRLAAFGFTGGRIDHTINALHALYRFSGKRDLVLIDQTDALCLREGSMRFSLSKGERVSIFAFRPTRFLRSYGLAYSLRGLELGFGERSGLSNEATGGDVLIEAERGAPYLIVVDQRRVSALWPTEGALDGWA